MRRTALNCPSLQLQMASCWISYLLPRMLIFSFCALIRQSGSEADSGYITVVQDPLLWNSGIRKRLQRVTSLLFQLIQRLLHKRMKRTLSSFSSCLVFASEGDFLFFKSAATHCWSHNSALYAVVSVYLPLQRCPPFIIVQSESFCFCRLT